MQTARFPEKPGLARNVPGHDAPQETDMSGKSFFVDLTRCTACRGCQVACKQWKQLPSEKTLQRGTHQNPADLSYNTIRLVRFSEIGDGDDFKWLFFPEQCRHCVEPPCKMAGDSMVEGAIEHDAATGAVIYTEKTKGLDFETVRGACPYDIPRQDPVTKRLSKCDMCLDRVRAGMLPSCVKTCPTGTMNFGDREDMLKLAQARLAEVQAKSPKAALVDADSVRVIYLAEVDPKSYYKYLGDAADPSGPGLTRLALFDKVLGPLRRM